MFGMDGSSRRGFLGRIFGAAAAASLPLGQAGAAAAQQKPSADAWIGEVKGTHRCLFDFPQHKGGAPLLHMLNYLNTYKESYKAAPGSAGAVGTFYGIGGQSSISLGFNDAMWAKYGLGDYLGLKDKAGKPYTRNVFNRPTADDAGMVAAAFQLPAIPELGEMVSGMGIESLQKSGAKFLLCANALGAWCLELAGARERGSPPRSKRNCAPTCCPA